MQHTTQVPTEGSLDNIRLTRPTRVLWNAKGEALKGFSFFCFEIIIVNGNNKNGELANVLFIRKEEGQMRSIKSIIAIVMVFALFSLVSSYLKDTVSSAVDTFTGLTTSLSDDLKNFGIENTYVSFLKSENEIPEKQSSKRKVSDKRKQNKTKTTAISDVPVVTVSFTANTSSSVISDTVGVAISQCLNMLTNGDISGK